MSRLRKVTLGWLAAGAVVFVTLLSLVYTPKPPNAINVAQRLKPPSWEHLAGTDELGRDLFSRLMAGGQVSLLIGLGAAAFSLLVGGALGAIAGYFGGPIDDITMRLMDAVLALPGILIALLIITLRGTGVDNTILALGIMGTPVIARVVRGVFLQGREMEYVLASRALGASSARLIFRHILPNYATPILVAFSINLAAAILSEASLSYLGLGTQPPDPSWGRMLQESQRYLGVAWWYSLSPGLTITFVVLAFYLLANDVQKRL